MNYSIHFYYFFQYLHFISLFEIDSYNTISEAIELIDEINSDNLKLMVDSYHIYLEEDPGFIWGYLLGIWS